MAFLRRSACRIVGFVCAGVPSPVGILDGIAPTGENSLSLSLSLLLNHFIENPDASRPRAKRRGHCVRRAMPPAIPYSAGVVVSSSSPVFRFGREAGRRVPPGDVVHPVAAAFFPFMGSAGVGMSVAGVCIVGAPHMRNPVSGHTVWRFRRRHRGPLSGHACVRRTCACAGSIPERLRTSPDEGQALGRGRGGGHGGG